MQNQKPNFLFLCPDQWRWDWLGCETSPYGKAPVRTPRIDGLAERGVRFTECRTIAPLCAPARAALALGTRYHRCGVLDNGKDLDPDRTTVFNLLRDAGYRTLTCGKNDLHKKSKWKGLEGWTARLGQYGFTDAIDQSGKLDARNSGRLDKDGPSCPYTSHLHARGLFETFAADYQRRVRESSSPTAAWPSPLERRDHPDDFCGRRALELLDRSPLDEPWMLWVNWPGPHDPFDPPRELQQRYDGVTFPEPVAGRSDLVKKDGARVPVDHQLIRRNYAAACEGIDEWVGHLLDAVAQRGELDNTVVIFTSDHGEMLGDHGRFLKQVPQEGSVHVPLIVAGPGIARGRTSAALVEWIDLSATMLELAGVPAPEFWDARSFATCLDGTNQAPEHRSVQISQLGDWRMAFDGRYKRVENRGSENTLHDLAEDPRELTNIDDRESETSRRLADVLEQEAPWPATGAL